MNAELAGALLACAYGCCVVFRQKMPLFFKIIFLAMLTCLMGNVYTVLYEWLWQPAGDGFQIGYLGYIGMFFFMFSSYYGAFNSLADGKQPELRRFRALAGAFAAAFCIAAATLMILWDKHVGQYLLLIPMTCTIYFAVKHLIIPDVDMGIIKVMRLYNALIVCLCICMMLRILSEPGSGLEEVSRIGTGILIALCLPAARNGCKKWFI